MTKFQVKKAKAFVKKRNRKPSAAFLKLDKSGKTGRGTDSTQSISEDREDRV